MLPTRKFNDLPLATELTDATKVFCVISGVDYMVTLSVLRDYLGVISGSGGGGGGSSGSGSGAVLLIADSYAELLTLGAGSEYYYEPYIYVKVGTGVLRISCDTEFSTPLDTTISGGIVVPTYSQLLTSDDGTEYHNSPYVYKKYVSGVLRISCDTDFTAPTGVGTATGIVYSTYADLLSSSMYGYEYHESPFIYKRTESGAFKINCDTDFSIP